MRKIIFVLVVLGVAGFFVSCRKSEEVAKSTVAAPRIAPDFELYNLEGKSVRLSDYKGKVVLVDFWATWCPPCRAEVPHFVKLYKDYSAKGLVIIGISLDEGGKKDIQPFVEEYDINYPIALGTEKVARDFGGVRGIPTTFVINRNGEIVKKLVGYHDEEEFESILKPLL